tara:strand:- start:321 stop:539 length:219 start_codon:yes stop_codon:yes gene_type:complete
MPVLALCGPLHIHDGILGMVRLEVLERLFRVLELLLGKRALGVERSKRGRRRAITKQRSQIHGERSRSFGTF